MENRIRGVEAIPPFRYFEELSAIPRASGNEAGAADYLVSFAAGKGLFFYRDKANNVFIRKPGSAGRAQEPPILLQAHTDMVAEAAHGVMHDFDKEGIRFVQEGSILRADGTTLGADDGCGVACILAALAEENASHPPLECLFTTSEETGLLGAGSFDYSLLRARRMLNLDSSDEREVIIGCCGGLRSDLSLPVHFTPAEGRAVRLSISGLCGGHSGEDIDKGRTNAHVLMGRLLDALRTVTPFRLISLSGGDKDNAIPRECEAVLLPADFEAAVSFLRGAPARARAALTCAEDAGLTVETAEAAAAPAMSEADTDRVLRVLALRNGVLYRRAAPPVMVETSRNLARIRTGEKSVTFGFSSRSAREDRIAESRAELDALGASLGGSLRHYAAYPGWESPAGSPLCRAWQTAYHAVTGGETKPTVIHAGLECGLISAALPGLDAISVGCNIHDLHTPAETLELDSFARIWRTVLAFLAAV